ncbi:sialate O-acetylesterase, partial [Escherichia coli]|nr:sialate O-acetylesterase [Escherichia coli]
PVAITPYTLMQAIAAEGDVTTPVVVQPSGDGGAVISTTSEPEYYFVIALAGQSNSMSFGEGLPLPDTYDRPDPRIKQLARRSTVTPGGAACAYNDIIP